MPHQQVISLVIHRKYVQLAEIFLPAFLLEEERQ
jgi:hypothetical protein